MLNAPCSLAAEHLLIERLKLYNSTWQVIVSHASTNTSDGDTGVQRSAAGACGSERQQRET